MKRLLLGVACLLFAGAATATTRYVACPAVGSGNCSSAGNACTFTTAKASHVAGDDYEFASGTVGSPVTYVQPTNSACFISLTSSFNGVSNANRTIIYAATPGGVVLDGGTSTTSNGIVNGSAYITITGFRSRKTRTRTNDSATWNVYGGHTTSRLTSSRPQMAAPHDTTATDLGCSCRQPKYLVRGWWSLGGRGVRGSMARSHPTGQ